MIFKVMESNNKINIWLLIIISAFIMRGATLFVEFYEVDVLTDVIMIGELLDGGKLFTDVVPSRPVYFIYFLVTFLIFGKGNLIALHFVTILWILCTSYVLYLINKELDSPKSGYWSAFFYVVFTSVFFEFYLATHGELILNLPLMLTLYFFIKGEKSKQSVIYYILTGFMIIVSIFSKGHGLILLPFFGGYLLIIKPYYLKEGTLKQNTKSLLLIASVVLIPFLIGLIGIILFTSFDLYLYLYGYFTGNFWYALEGWIQSANFPVVFLRIFYNLVNQSPLWVLLYFFLKQEKPFSQRKVYPIMLIYFFIISYLAIFLGGFRVYHHYFLISVPTLCLIAGQGLIRYIEAQRSVKWLIGLLILAFTLFPIWNYRNAWAVHYSPESVLSINHAVNAKKPYKRVCEWIKENSNPEDRIVQWGDCIEMYFFTQRKSGMPFLWCSAYGRNYFKAIKEYPFDRYFIYLRIFDPIINKMNKTKPRYFIDTSSSNFRGFQEYSLNKFPFFRQYILSYYKYKITIDNMVIYERINY